MKKIVLFIVSLLFLVFAWRVKAFSLGQLRIHNSFGQSLTHQVQRLYLKIPGSKPGKLVLQQALAQLPRLKTAQVSIQSNIDVFNSAKEKQNSLIFSAEGPMQIQTLTNPHSYNQDMNMMVELAMADATLATNFDLIKYQEKAFFKLNQVPALPSLDLKSIKDTWLEIELEELNPDVQRDMSEEQVQQVFVELQTLLQKTQVSKAERQVVAETPVFLVKLTFSKDDLVAFFEAIDSLPNDRRQKFEQLDEVEVALLVDAQTYFIRRIVIPLSVEGEQTQAFSTSELDTVGAFSDASYIEIEFVLEMSEFNQQVLFEIPTETTNMEDGLLKVLQPLESEKTGSRTPAELSVLSARDKQKLENIEDGL